MGFRIIESVGESRAINSVLNSKMCDSIIYITNWNNFYQNGFEIKGIADYCTKKATFQLYGITLAIAYHIM